MNDDYDALFDAYDRGQIGRAEVIRTLRGYDPREEAQPHESHPGVLVGVNLHHDNIVVSDLERTEQFYRRLFSLAPKRPVPGRPDILDLADGVSFLSVPQRQPAGVIDHFCIGVRDFEPNRVADLLTANGFTDGLTVGEDNVYVSDPDGVRVQISSPTWRG